MKTRLLCILLALCSLTFSLESYANTKNTNMTPQVRAQKKLLKKQKKQMAKYYKAQRKAEKKQQKELRKRQKLEKRSVLTGF
jgi:hypothetical protein